ncbi:MAG: DUF1328 family protein [Methanomicrobiales archaeon]
MNNGRFNLSCGNFPCAGPGILYTGAKGIAGFSIEIAKWLVIIFIIIAIITFIL